jgi:hypothetical protein
VIKSTVKWKILLYALKVYADGCDWIEKEGIYFEDGSDRFLIVF